MTDEATPSSRRRTVQLLAVTLASLTSLMYFLIGFQVLTVLENPEDQTVFGLISGTAFLLGAVAIQVFGDRRLLMGLGALTQAFIIFTYLNLASEREPAFEVWGITIRVIQVLLLAALVYLAARPAPIEPVPAERPADRVAVG